MAQHSVRIEQTPLLEVLHKDLQIVVRADDEKLGTLTISKGGVGWFPSFAQQERHFTWEQFDRLIRESKG